MVNQFVMMMLLFTLIFVGSGGGTSGDPAPGRSPGPPSTIECNTNIVGKKLVEIEQYESFVNFTLVHRLFKTDFVVAGIEYEVVVERRAPGPPIQFALKSQIDETPYGKFLTNNLNKNPKCLYILTDKLDSASSIHSNWTLDHHIVDPTQSHNLTFILNYQVNGDSSVYTTIYPMSLSQDCQLHLQHSEAIVNSRDISSHITDCQIWFPSHSTSHGLVIELNRLNVPCSRGYIHFSGLNVSQQQQQQHFRSSHRQAHICGKLEELPENDRRIYFPFSHMQPTMHIRGNPIFTISYHLVDYCYNVTFVQRNNSFELKKPTSDLQCTFRIYLPYGNRVALNLLIGDGSTTGTPATASLQQARQSNYTKCQGLQTQLLDGENTWTHCTQAGDLDRQIQVVSHENKIVLRVTVQGTNSLGLHMTYQAEPIDSIVGVCGFGWVALKQFCVTAVEDVKLPWHQAEMECVRRGGHLASIRSESGQTIINNLLLNSPGYKDHNAYWIGASDKIVEGDFRWSDGLPFSYTNWFPGWSQHGHYNRQPNDDGLSEQDCVEVRRIYSLPTASASLASAFMWNDRDCSTPNYFICERLQNNEPLEDNWPPDCNRSVELSRQQPRAVVSSPGFPRQYPDNADCDTDITAPNGYRLVLDFEELVLENETLCSYDYLEILENNSSSSNPISNSSSLTSTRRLCGDWSSKLKLLRYVSNGSKLKLRFSSDYSHHFGGYKARVKMESALQCADDRLHLFNNSCYLFISYPEVTWSTAQQICQGKKAHLTSILTPDEERFITTQIRKSPDYRTSALYWLGATSTHHQWTDGHPISYQGWLPGQRPSNLTNHCLSIQWTPSPTPMLPSGLYWTAHKCTAIGGYVCKRPTQHSPANFSKIVEGSSGMLTTPHHPEQYYNNLDFNVRIIGPDRTRILIKFHKLDIEPQLECLYDYVVLQDESNNVAKFCGMHDVNMHRFNFVSKTNEVQVIFHSDYSIGGAGFALSWQAIDVSACPLQTLTAKEGIITSPNYPDFLLAGLDCTWTVLAPLNKRIWIQFQEYNIENEASLQVNIKNSNQMSPLSPFQLHNLLTEGSFISQDQKLQIRLKTQSHPTGFGFKAMYKILNFDANIEKIINLTKNTTGTLLHLNYPDFPPKNINFTQHFVAPLGYIIQLQLFRVKLATSDGCGGEKNNGMIEVIDNYYDTNGSTWRLCYEDDNNEENVIPVQPISITSFLHTVHVRQISGGKGGVALNASLRVEEDGEFKEKLLGYKDDGVESCVPNLCQNGGKCVSKGSQKFCQCVGHFTGLFCALTKCELDPCVFGTCQLTNTSYKCHCKSGYIGPTCEQKRKPCEGNPCESRGVCVPRGDGFICRCHAWWEGARCEKRMLHIPYKPLSERMFHEPFWLGLMTVFVVMAVIGLVWCAKRHFPEKIEKLLAEENERNRSTMSSLRSSSVREQLAVASGQASAGTAAMGAPSPGPAAPRSLFGRLGIRKPSILSLTSPHASGYVPATARTFSLDDLLKPLPRRSPSPKKKRNNSTPTKKNAAEKKQILQQLISPNTKQLSRKVSLGELLQLSDQRNKLLDDTSKETIKETKFTASNIVSSSETVQSALSDPKLEKKVTFARLLNKVSAEMSSGSELELGIMQTNRLGCVWARPSSTPPSPHTDTRSPNSCSSNQGSDSLTSSDLAIPTALCRKPSSADSILAMFRNFSSSSAGVNLPPSLRVSPSTTPTASTPQDDIVGDDESSTSGSCHQIVVVESPSTIEVPVLDALSAHKTNSGNLLHPPTILLEVPSTGVGKCLSPIREMPTPLPSPIPTPLLRRSREDVSEDVGSVSVVISDDDEEEEEEEMQCRHADIKIDPQGEDGLILEEAAAMHLNSRPLVIPMLTIQTPSPTHTPRTIPTLLFPGSPPPHKETCCFNFNNPPTTAPPAPQKSRKLFKDFDKPTSLDLPCAPPMITITCNMSEAESDAESISPAAKTSHLGTTSTGMSYLSPFSMGNQHNASESNLSSSGYSSMASPGPSRCGSSNPLCPSEMEDQGPPGAGHSHRRPSPVLKLGSTSGANMEKTNGGEQRRGRSDSETLSDDPLIESNDEGIGTDHIDEKIEEGDVKSAKELEVFMVGETVEDPPIKLDLPFSKNSLLQLPSIIVQCEDPSTTIKVPPSPMSSRSESPLSDRTSGLARFSPQFYGRNKDLLPFTDSDGLYDFPSSDKVNVLTGNHQQHRKTGRKREKKTLMRNCKTPSPTKVFSPIHNLNHLDVPNSKDVFYKVPPPRKLSPKRRVTRSQQIVSSSSSSDSIHSARELRKSSSSPSPDTIRWSSPVDWMDENNKCQPTRERNDNEEEEEEEDRVNDDVNSAMLPKVADPKHSKISRLRAISHQIRFLRRLELSLKRRERAISPSDSLDSGDDSPRCTSPLLQQKNTTTKVEIRKSSSIGKLQPTTTTTTTTNKSTKKGKYKKSGGELLLPQHEERSWKRVVITGNGHSD